jgi:hypothetical protein
VSSQRDPLILKFRWDYSTPPKKVSIEDAVERTIDGPGFEESGELEGLRYKLDDATRFLASLTVTLYKSGKLTDQEILDLLDSFERY